MVKENTAQQLSRNVFDSRPLNTADYTPVELGRIERLVEALGMVSAAANDEFDAGPLYERIINASPLPLGYDEDGKIFSVPLQREWDAVNTTGPDRIPDDDQRWYSLPDPVVAFVTPAFNGKGQGDRDARLLVDAANAVPILLGRIKWLEAELAKRH